LVILIQNGYELNELHGVLISSEANNDLLVYESSTSLWKNKTISTIFGGTPLVSVPTLAQVTTAGNTTTNAITVGGLTVATNLIYTDTVNGRVGIGTTGLVPGFLLTINGSVSISAGQSLTLDPSAGIYMVASSSQFRVYTGAIAALSIANTGNVLINTTTDAGYKLDVNGTTRMQGAVVFSNSSISNLISLQSSTSTSFIWQGNNTSLAYQQNNLNIQPYTGSLGVHISNLDGTTILYAKASTTGDSAVGVGTMNPLAKFHVTGSKTAASALAQGVYFNNTLVAAANNDVLVGLDIAPTFTNGAFTGVSNIGLRVSGQVLFNAYGAYNTVTPTLRIENVDTNNVAIQIKGNVANYKYYWIYDSQTTEGIYKSDQARIDFYGGTNVGFTFRNNYGRLFTIVGSTGNVLIGTTTDAGYKLDVNGTARVGNDFTIDNNRYLKAYRWTNADTSLPLQLESNSTYNVTGINFISYNNSLLNNTKSLFTFGLASPITTQSSGSVDVANVINIVPEINFANGTHTVRGIYYNPTLTSLTGTTHRAIETTSGDVIFNGGNVGIGTSSPTDKIHIVDNTNGNKFGRISAGGTNASAAWVAQNDQVDNVVYRVFGSAVTGTQMGISLARSASLMANLGGSGKFLVGTYSSTDFVMGTGNQERMRLVDTTGNFLIGTTADNGNKLQVSGSIDSTGYSINNIAGYTGLLMIPGNPPGMQNIDIQGGIIVNIF
jgi:hypothetical protein